jgi:hypothetical protein
VFVATAVAAFLASNPVHAASKTQPQLRYKWNKVALQPASLVTQIVSAARVDSPEGPLWLLAGATAPAPPTRRPAVWSSNDLSNFTPVELAPLPGYGEIAEVFGISGQSARQSTGQAGEPARNSAGRVAAIAQAFGGAHGNARTASWVGTHQALSEVRANFELYNGIRQIAVRSIAAGDAGFVIFGSRVNQNGALGAASWTSSDGDEFVLHDNDEALSSGFGEQVQGLDLVADGAGGFVAVGERLWWKDPGGERDVVIDTDAMVWRSGDGVKWRRDRPAGFILGGPGGQRLHQVLVFDGEVVAAGTETSTKTGLAKFVVWSSAGKGVVSPFPPTSDALSTVTGFERVGDQWFLAARVSGQLLLAASSDLRIWKNVSLPFFLPSGGRAKLIVIPGTSDNPLLLGASGLNGGGLFSGVLIG